MLKRRNKKGPESINVSEYYKRICANIMFSILKKGCKKIVISSSFPLEGKSTVSINISKTLSRMGLKVLLIDADLKSPSIRRAMNIKKRRGLSDLLIRQKLKNIYSYTYNEESDQNLYILTAGTTVINTAEMLSSDSMKKFLENMESEFDYIIIDTSPIELLSDALYVSKFTDGIILVIKENVSRYSNIDKTLRALELIDVPILGFILNFASDDNKKYGYNYKYGEYGVN